MNLFSFKRKQLKKSIKKNKFENKIKLKLILTSNQPSNWASPVALTMILLTWYLKTGISNILHTPVWVRGLLISVVCSFISPNFVSEMFSPSLEWENCFDRKVRRNLCNLCSGHLLSVCEATHWGTVGSSVTYMGQEKSLLASQVMLLVPGTVYVCQGTTPLLCFWDCIISPLYYFGSSSQCEEERKRGKCLAEQLHWRQEAEGLPAVALVLIGKQMMIWKWISCLVFAFRTLWAPFHSFSNSIFRTLVLSDSHKSFKYQFASDERFCVYSLCGFP